MSLEEQKSNSETTATRRHSSISNKQSKETLGRRHSERHQVVKIQNYVIYRKTIGAGSMGKVKLAECLTDVHKQKYAVKIMPKVDLLAIADSKSSRSKDPKDTPEEREQRTIREMAIMRLLRHPNICQLKEYITEGDKYYMFLEYVDGGQLLDYIIKHGKLREKQARKFARQIVSALDYCHRNSIVHRDLKIENILITQSEQLKIIDFGLSNVYSPTEQLNTFCGSLYFAAPELLKAREYTGPEVDVWSFGVVLYVLVCGRVPFDDTNLPALHEKIKAGIVEDYPDHLGKDCLDLLSKIFVVDPNKRITLSAIQAHPWMNKGYEEPIRNYLPHRQPLENIDMEIVNGMHGFGLGSPEEIQEKLQKIISSAAYQVAALKIDQNYQKKANDDQTLANRPRWRRTLSTRKKVQVQDDFQSLPAMYDPLVSIYYLVKERKESNERKKQLLEAEANHITLSRSTSTLVTSSRSNTNTNSSNTPPIAGQQPSLVRRRTFDTSKKLPDLPAFISPTSSEKKEASSNTKLTASDVPNNTPTLNASKSEKVPGRTTLLRQKSLQAVMKFGIKLPNSIHNGLSSHATDNNVTTTNDGSNISSSSSATTTATAEEANSNNKNKANSVHINGNTSKPHWLKLELSSKNSSAAAVKQQKRQSTNPTSSTTSSKPGWRRMSISRRNTRLSFDSSTGNLPTQADPMLTDNNTVVDNPAILNTCGKPLSLSANQKDKPVLVMESSKSEVISSFKTNQKKSDHHPKSIFHFNRAHLFRVTPEQMMKDLQKVLQQLDIQSTGDESHFTLQCQCPYSAWSRFIKGAPKRYNNDESLIRDDEPHHLTEKNLAVLKFHVMIYEARWARGKIGFKVKEDDHQENAALTFYIKQVLKNLYNSMLNEIGHMYHSTSAV